MWLYFSVLLGLLPVGVALFLQLFDIESHPLRQGDLFLLGSGLCFFAMGELFMAGVKPDGSKVVFIKRCGQVVVVSIADTVAYVATAASQHPNNLLVDGLSIAGYILSVVCSLFCILDAGR